MCPTGEAARAHTYFRNVTIGLRKEILKAVLEGYLRASIWRTQSGTEDVTWVRTRARIFCTGGAPLTNSFWTGPMSRTMIMLQHCKPEAKPRVRPESRGGRPGAQQPVRPDRRAVRPGPRRCSLAAPRGPGGSRRSSTGKRMPTGRRPPAHRGVRSVKLGDRQGALPWGAPTGRSPHSLAMPALK